MRVVLLSVGGGLVGVAVGLLAWHLWVDHQTLHQMIGVMGKQLQQYPLK